MAEEKELKLSHVEKQALIGLNVREQVIAKEIISPFQQDVKETIKSIEERLELKEGAINTTHVIDLQAGVVISKPQEEDADSPLLDDEKTTV